MIGSMSRIKNVWINTLAIIPKANQSFLRLP
jgi:hypothetical protein